MVVGGAMPVKEVLKLEAIDPLKAPYFLTRREMGIFNVGGPGIVRAGDAIFQLDYKEALYLGAGDRDVTFESTDAAHPAKFYFNSLAAHRNYPDKKVTKADAVVAEMGTLEGSNHRNINKMLVNQVLPTCQLQLREVCGIRCLHMSIAVVWRLISILKYRKSMLCAILWVRLTKPVMCG